MLSFKPAFSFSSYTLIKRLFSSSSLSGIRVVPSAYLRSSIFLLTILISASDSSGPAFHPVNSAQKLKAGRHYTACPTPFPPWSQLFHVCFTCCFLTCIQVSQETCQVVWYYQLFKNFPQYVAIHTVKSFSIVNEAEVDIFLLLPCFLYDPKNVGNLISGSSASLKPSLLICKFSGHILRKPSSKDFEHHLASMGNEPGSGGS